MELLGLAGLVGVCVLFTVVLAQALWTSGDAVRQVDSVRSGRSWATLSYGFFLLIVVDLIVLALFLKNLKRAQKRSK